MDVKITPASIEEKPILRHLLELYQYDFSEYDGADVDPHGLYGYKYLDHYWTEPERHPFLLRVSGKLAGFVLVRQVGEQDGLPVHAIAEFFVMRKYRRQGVGRKAAFYIFDMFPGMWSVSQEAENVPAQKFWRKVIGEYTGGAYTEEFLDDEEWHGPRQMFRS